MYELRHLRAFCAIAEELHFGRAAARLHITQPPLSQLLKQLESIVGERLFRRSTRSVQLTDAGRELLLHARTILDHSDRALREVRKAAAGSSGELTIGFVPSATYQFMPSMIRTFRALYPDVRLQFKEMVSERQFEQIDRGVIDIGIVRPPIPASGVEAALIWKERFVVAVPMTHKFASLESISIKSLTGEPFITYGPGDSPYFCSRVSALLSASGVHPNVVQRGAIHAILAFVAAGIGVAIVSGSAQSVSIRNVRFLRLRHLGADDQAELFAVWSRNRESALISNWLSAAAKKMHQRPLGRA